MSPSGTIPTDPPADRKAGVVREQPRLHRGRQCGRTPSPWRVAVTHAANVRLTRQARPSTVVQIATAIPTMTTGRGCVAVRPGRRLRTGGAGLAHSWAPARPGPGPAIGPVHVLRRHAVTRVASACRPCAPMLAATTRLTWHPMSRRGVGADPVARVGAIRRRVGAIRRRVGAIRRRVGGGRP